MFGKGQMFGHQRLVFITQTYLLLARCVNALSTQPWTGKSALLLLLLLHSWAMRHFRCGHSALSSAIR